MSIEQIVQQRWLKMSQDMHEDSVDRYRWLAPLVDALREHPRIGKLFPYTSHATLSLSRTTHYPYSCDCPRIDAVAENVFRVYGAHGVLVKKIEREHRWKELEYEVLGEGVDEAVAWIDAGLPIGFELMVDGNTWRLRRAEGKSVVQFLLNAGADVNARTDYGETALGIAVFENKSPEILHLLREWGGIE